jgi:chemotaxis protein CheX
MDLIQPFINAADAVFAESLQGPTKIGDLLMEEGAYRRKGVAALIVIKGDIEGRIILDLETDVALKVAAILSGAEVVDNEQTVRETVCELANMVIGSAITSLNDQGFRFKICPPVIHADELGEGSEDRKPGAGDRNDLRQHFSEHCHAPPHAPSSRARCGACLQLNQLESAYARVTKPLQNHTHLKSGAPRFTSSLPIIWDHVGQHYAVYRWCCCVLPSRSEGHVSFNGEFAALLPWIDRRMRGCHDWRATFHPLHDDEPRTAYRRTITPLRKRRSTSSRFSRTPSGKTTVRARLCERTVCAVSQYCDPGAVRQLKANAEHDITVDGPDEELHSYQRACVVKRLGRVLSTSSK